MVVFKYLIPLFICYQGTINPKFNHNFNKKNNKNF